MEVMAGTVAADAKTGASRKTRVAAKRRTRAFILKKSPSEFFVQGPVAK
jgi:hypothetical protein